MKRAILLIAISAMIHGTSFSQENATTLDLSTGWKIKTGDSIDYVKPEYDDSDWKSIKVGLHWSAQGFGDYEGTACYRLKVVIPTSIPRDESHFSGLELTLGRIDPKDITYFNGVEIGKTNVRDAVRKYIAPFDLIRWDKENVIAVRVMAGKQNGAMCAGPYSIGCCTHNLPDSVSILPDNDPVTPVQPPDASMFKTIRFQTKDVIKSLPVELRVKVRNTVTNGTILDKSASLSLGKTMDNRYDYSLTLAAGGSYRADYYLSSKSFEGGIASSCLLAYKSGDHSNPKAVKPVVQNVISSKAAPLELSRLELSGYLGARYHANIAERLLRIDEQGILQGFISPPGDQTWVGDYAGKYLHAAATSWSNTRNDKLKSQMDRIVDILISCQHEDGYLGTYLPRDYWTEWDVWTHKEDLLGLLNYYAVTGYQPALNTCVKIGDLLCKTFGSKPGQINIEETGYHVGMASTSVLEPMVELYRFTGDKKYLDFCRYILEAYEHPKGPKIISTLNSIGKVDKTANAKAYEMFENFIGIAKLYLVTGDSELLSAVEKGWSDVAAFKLYVTGTCSKGECFQKDFILPAENDDAIGEGCVSFSWLQFNQVMYYLTGKSKYVDEMEKTIYNHLLAAENPETGCVAYYTALQGVKPYRCTIYAHCCLASVPKGIALIPELAYTKSAEDGLNINFYTSGHFDDRIKRSDGKVVPVHVSVESKFPEMGSAEVSIGAPEESTFSVALRVPAWCTDFVAKIGNEMFNGTPGEYTIVNRSWPKGSKIQISFGLNVQSLDGGISYLGFKAIKSGAQILAFDKALNPEIEAPDKLKIGPASIRALSKNALPNPWFGDQVYAASGQYDGKPVEIKLVPFAEAGQTGGEVRVWIKDVK